MRTLRGLLLVVAALTLPAALGHAQVPPTGPQSPTTSLPGPSAERVQSAINAEVPSGWMVDTVRVTAQINEGDAISPVIRQRFMADASATEDLFVPSGEPVGPFTIVVRTQNAAATVALHGTLRAAFSGGVWDVDLNLENDLTAFGRPAAAIGMPILIAGTPEARAKIGEIAQADALREGLEQLEREGERQREAIQRRLDAQRDALLAEADVIERNGEARRTELLEQLDGEIDAILQEATARRANAEATLVASDAEAERAVAQARARVRQAVEEATPLARLNAELDALGNENELLRRMTEAQATNDALRLELRPLGVPDDYWGRSEAAEPGGANQ